MKRKKDGADDPITALFYDCGGQNIYQTANELFFTPRSVVLLVFDMQALLQSGDLTVLRSWLNNISVHSPSSPIILVGTHAGELWGFVGLLVCLFVLSDIAASSPPPDKVRNQEDHVGISEMLRTEFGQAGYWQRVVGGDQAVVMVPVDNTRGDQDSGIQQLRALIVKVSHVWMWCFEVGWMWC